MKVIRVNINTKKRDTITLSDKDFKAKGGEKKVYIKDGIAFGIYHDALNVMPEGKVEELAKLSLPNILRPIEFLYEGDKRVGEAAVAVTDARELS